MDPLSLLLLFQGLFEELPLETHDGGPEHGDQPSVCVIREALVPGLLDQAR